MKMCIQIISYKHSPIWKLIDEREWSDVLAILSDPTQLIPSSRRYIHDASAKLPLLSYALWNKAPVVILEVLMSRDESQVLLDDSKGRLPIHIACIRKRAPAVIDLLLNEDTRPVAISDRKGNLPLHYAIFASELTEDDAEPTEEQLDVITSIIASYPGATLMLNRDGLSPLDLARQQFGASHRRGLYPMLLKTSKTLKLQKACMSEELSAITMQMSSSSFFLKESSGFMPENDPIDETLIPEERQAFGERPQRRNCIVAAMF